MTLCDYEDCALPRRHFLQHLAGASSLMLPAISLLGSVRARADELRKDQKSAILLWLSGGPSSIDLWDLKPGAATAGPFRPIATTGAGQICEHLPKLARQMKHLSIVRSMSTREADHGRGRYYMHTGFVPNPSVQHPGYGSVVAHQLMDQRPELAIPPFVAIGGGSVGPGFLGMTWAPFVVTADGNIKNLRASVADSQLMQRMTALGILEHNFIQERRGRAAEDHAKVLDKTLSLMTSAQLQAFDCDQEPAAVRDRYGSNSFGRACLMARRLVQAGVPFVEIDMGGWDNHANIFPTLQNDRLPVLDAGFSALIEDLQASGLLATTAVICMGEFGRTPRINGAAGRDHWARAWSVVVGGAGFAGGKVIGETSADGTAVVSKPYSSQDLMASVCQALGISLETTFTTPSGRPMRIANGGKGIADLVKR
jgi:uncharacterized protein (DUF1501 family)